MIQTFCVLEDERVVGLRALLAEELQYAVDWLEKRLHTHRLCIPFEVRRKEIRDDTLASQLSKLLLGLKQDGTNHQLSSFAGDEGSPESFGFSLKAYWEPAVEDQKIDKRPVNPHTEGNNDPSVVAEYEMREGPLPSPPEREGFNMKECYSDAHLLFETVKSFREIRDRHRLSKLANVLGINMTSRKDPTIHEVENLINKLGGKSFGSYKANQIAAQEIQGILNDLGFRIACPKIGCNKVATLHCTTGTRTKNGVFVFVHPRSTGQAHHGGYAALPKNFELLPLPPGKKQT